MTARPEFAWLDRQEVQLKHTHIMVMVDALDDYAAKCDADGDVEVAGVAREARGLFAGYVGG